MTLEEWNKRSESLRGAKVAGVFELETLIGVGSMGAVFRARDGSGRPVALKLLHPELMASDAARRFEREADILLSMRHPNLVETLAAGHDSKLDLLYIAMPLLQGEDLDTVLARRGALPENIALRLAVQAGRALAAAHAASVVHRDVKPGNLYLEQGLGNEVILRVCDFGIAKRLLGGPQTPLTATGTQLGTPDYVAPEQLRDSKNVDPRVDVWGLGATLYEMLSGEPPFGHHQNVFDVIGAILSEPVPSLAERAPWLREEVVATVHEALAKKPEERFGSMSDFLAALESLVASPFTVTRADLALPSPKRPTAAGSTIPGSEPSKPPDADLPELIPVESVRSEVAPIRASVSATAPSSLAPSASATSSDRSAKRGGAAAKHGGSAASKNKGPEAPRRAFWVGVVLLLSSALVSYWVLRFLLSMRA
ncbi:MAG TPA: serine/threonine-protein kinase [Polyangiaceae bacterium]|nr:serine/threonine-protein kinase [Polyangiaceae bacterium]